MHRTPRIPLHHGYALLLGWVFRRAAGVAGPFHATIARGGRARRDRPPEFFRFAVLRHARGVTADSIWYQLGRRKGIKVLQLLCKISLEPDSCVRRTEGLFSKQGARSLLLAKFIPGLGTVAPPLAGIFHMRPERFFFFDAMGSLLWAGTFSASATYSAVRSNS